MTSSMDDISVSINKDSVEVRLDPSSRSPNAKLGGAVFIVSVGLVVLCAMLFIPGKHNGPSLFQNISGSGIESVEVLIPFGILIIGVGLTCWGGFWWSAAAWPSDETLHCDETILTISRIPYLDFRNRR